MQICSAVLSSFYIVPGLLILQIFYVYQRCVDEKNPKKLDSVNRIDIS